MENLAFVLFHLLRETVSIFSNNDNLKGRVNLTEYANAFGSSSHFDITRSSDLQKKKKKCRTFLQQATEKKKINALKK